MQYLSQLKGQKLVSKLKDLIEKKSVVTVSYSDALRDVYLVDIEDDKVLVYQKGNNISGKDSGYRKMFFSEVNLLDIVKTNVNFEDWKKEVKESFSNLEGSDLKSKVQDLIDSNSVVNIAYENVFRTAYFLSVENDKVLVYQQNNDVCDKEAGYRKMFFSKLMLCEVVKSNVNLENWKNNFSLESA